MERKLGEVHPLLTLCGTIVENWQGNPIQKESLRVFFLVLQVTHYLDAGQVGKPLVEVLDKGGQNYFQLFHKPLFHVWLSQTT